MPYLDRDRLMKRTKAQILDEADAHFVGMYAQYRDRVRALYHSHGISYTPELDAMHNQIADLEWRLKAVLAENRALKGQGGYDTA